MPRIIVSVTERWPVYELEHSNRVIRDGEIAIDVPGPLLQEWESVVQQYMALQYELQQLYDKETK